MARRGTRRIVRRWPGHGARARSVSGPLAGVVACLLVAGSVPGVALPPPAGRADHGAAGSARNGVGGELAPSPSMASWPGTGPGGNGGPFAFVGAQYGPLWDLPTRANNSLGVGYCVMEDVRGEGVVRRRPDPAVWDAAEMARAAALMATFGGDRVVPYGIDGSGDYDVRSGEWRHPALLGRGEYTRRRHVAVNFGVRMLLEDVSPGGVAAGRKLARDSAVVNGAGGDFVALRSGYDVARRLVDVAERQHAVGGARLRMVWRTPGGEAPTRPGSYRLEVRATDGRGKALGYVPVLQLSGVGVGDHRSSGAVARVDDRSDTPGDRARTTAARRAGWPTWDLRHRLVDDRRFAVGQRHRAADVTDADGVARFEVEITAPAWELAFRVQAPTADVELYAGTGLQGQVTWAGGPQWASVHQSHAPPPTAPERHVAVHKTADDPAVSVAGTVLALVDASGHEVQRVTLGEDGRGTFDPLVPSRAEPPFVLRELRAAPGLVPLPADIALPPPAELSTDPEAPTVIEVRNERIIGTISTAATDAADGDQVVDLGPDRRGAVVDTVTYCGLYPGVEYEAEGEIHLVDGEGAVTPSGIVGATTFVPVDACGTVEVRIEVDPSLRAPAGPAGTSGVVFQRITVAGTDIVVAEHVDPEDPAQTIRFLPTPAPPTTPPPTTTTAPPPTTTTAPPTPASSVPSTTTTTAPASSVPSTTTTTAPTAAPPPSTTTTTAPSTTSTSSTTTTVPVAPGPATPDGASGRELPRTGSGARHRLVLGGVLVLAGVAVLGVLRRPTARSRAAGRRGRATWTRTPR